jgi:hypothetical protein
MKDLIINGYVDEHHMQVVKRKHVRKIGLRSNKIKQMQKQNT